MASVARHGSIGEIADCYFFHSFQRLLANSGRQKMLKSAGAASDDTSVRLLTPYCESTIL
jgi:hypothetical protein